MTSAHHTHARLYTLAAIALTVGAVIAMVCINARAEAHRAASVDTMQVENAGIDSQPVG